MEIKAMEAIHLDQVWEIENATFPIPWSKNAFQKELSNTMAIYFVAILEDKIVGYGGMWHIINEGHITNIAVAENFRGMGIGKALIEALINKAIDLEMIGITLEVKISNLKAQKIYTALGFKPEGIRKNYYEDTKEDAVIMWKEISYSDQI